MKRTKRRLLSVITALALVLNLSSATIASAQDIIKESSQVEKGEETTEGNEGDLKLKVYDDEDNVIYSDLGLKYQDGDTVDKVLKRVLSDRVEYLDSGDSIYINRIDGIGKTDGEPSDWNVYVNNELVQKGLNKINISNSDSIDIKFESKMDDVSDNKVSRSDTKSNVIGTVNVGVYGNSDETTCQKRNVEIVEGDTAYTVLVKVVGEENLDVLEIGSTVILNGIFGLDDMSKDGWIYGVNNEMPLEAHYRYKLKDGDNLVWHYDTNKSNPQIEKSYSRLESFIAGNNETNSDSTKITISVERRVLGKTDIIKSEEVKVNKGERVSKILDELLNDKGIKYNNSGSLDSSFYLQSITVDGEVIGERDHGFLSGWMYSVNGVRPGYGMSDYRVENGDFIRICYTAKDFGGDIDAVDKVFEVREKLNEISELNKDEYTTESWERLQSEVKEAKNKVPSNEEIGKMMSTTLGSGDCNTDKLSSEMKGLLTNLEKALDNLQIKTVVTLEDAIDKSATYYREKKKNLTSWWDMVAAISLGEDITKSPYTTSEYSKTPITSNSSVTDDAGVIIGILAQGKDVKNYKEEGNNVAKVLADKQKSDGGFGASNATMWAMIALEMANQEYDKDAAIDNLISTQKSDGGFAFFGSTGDPDMTGMGLITLGFFQGNDKVDASIEKAVNFLDKAQKEDGNFDSWGNVNSNSLACAIMGLVSVGEDVNAPKWNNMVDTLISYQFEEGEESGQFKWLPTDTRPNGMATQQSSIALGDALDGKAVWVEIAESYDDLEENRNQLPAIHATDKEVSQGDKVNLLEGVYATDKEDGSVEVKIKETNLVLENGVANTPGEFKVVYVATDKNGASVTKEIKITVIEKEEDSSIVEPAISIKDAMVSSAAWIIKNNPSPKFGDEWDIFSLARSGEQIPRRYFDNYYKEVEKTVIEKQGNLTRNKYSEYSRTILALTAIGKDPTDVGGYNLVEKLYDIDKVALQGINGVIWALIALDSQNYEIPEGVNNSREQMINYLLDNQLEDGGLALSGNKGDVDITAMALQSLANYKDQPKVAACIEKAMNFLSSSQKENGGYDSWGTANVESAAQVLVALSVLEIDPKNDEFVKNGNWIVSNIMTFASEDGGFKHVLNGDSDQIATQQALYSLTAYQRYLEGENSLYDTTDIVITPEEPENDEPGSGDADSDDEPGSGNADSDDDTSSDGNTNVDDDSNTDGGQQKPNKGDKDESKSPQTGDVAIVGLLTASTLSIGGLFMVNRKRK